MAPCRTRNSAVAEFPGIAQLFPNLCGDVAGGRQQGTLTLMDVIAVSSGRKKIADEDGQFVFMELHFWPSPSSPNPMKPSFSVSVGMPGWWTPKMYLGALCISVKRQDGRIVVSSKRPSACVPHAPAYNTINHIHWLFNRNKKELLKILQSSAQYFEVRGGENAYKVL